MDRDAQRREVDLNYDALQRNLAAYLKEHRGAYALMKGGKIIDFFARPGEAYEQGKQRFVAEPFSVQEITDEPIDLGLFSRVGN